MKHANVSISFFVMLPLFFISLLGGKKKKTAKVLIGLYQNWAHARRKHQAHALAPPRMSPYFGKAHGLWLLTYIKQIHFDLVKLSMDFKPYIRKAHNYRV
jgi:hypothetical protein